MSRLGVGEALHLRLFMEGVELPVVSASVAIARGNPASATIEIIATDRALQILPRTVVHLFYLDYQEAEFEGVPDKSRLDGTYKLMFCGEVFSISFGKTGPGSRGISLQCLDFSNIWDTSYLFSMQFGEQKNSGPDATGAIVGNQSQFLGAGGASLFDDIIQPSAVAISNGLSQTKAENPALGDTAGVVGGLFYILEYLGGVRGVTLGVNDWATITEARVRLMDQLGGDSGKTASNLFKSTVFDEWITKSLGAEGATISFRDLITTICSFTYYMVVPNPIAKYQSGERKVTAQPPMEPPVTPEAPEVYVPPETAATPVADQGIYRPVVTFLTNTPGNFFFSKFRESGKRGGSLKESQVRAAGIIEEVMRQKTMPREFIAAAIANALAESNLNPSIHSGSRPSDPVKFVARHGPTALSPEGFENSVGLFQLFGGKSGIGFGMTDAEREDPRLNTLQILQDVGLQAMLAAFRSSIAAGQPLTFGECARLWATLIERPANKEVEGEFRKNLAEALFPNGIGTSDLGVVDPRINTGETVAYYSIQPPISQEADEVHATLPVVPSAVRERLITQMFLPDIWYTAPPLCNIVFPEEYSDFNFSRSMLRETTRLQLQTNNTLIGTDTIIASTYFAPSFSDGEELVGAGFGSASASVATGRPLVYEHEKFSGIIPKIERMSDVSFHSASEVAHEEEEAHSETPLTPTEAAKKQASANVEKATENADIHNDIERYAAHSATYDFLKNRYMARQASVTARFLPRIVCGFPALLVNRPQGVDGVTPTHFLGMVESVQHSLSQSGGQTSFTMSCARSHRGGDLADDPFVRKKILKTQLPGEDKVTVIDINESIGIDAFQFAYAVQLQLGSREYSSPLLLPPEIKGPSGLVVSYVVIKDRTPTSILRADTIKATNGAFQQKANVTFPFVFSQLEVHERPAAGILPVEEAIRPPWISDEYSNANIGSQIHDKLLGCRSLIDAVGSTPDPGYSEVSIEKATNDVVQEYSRLTEGAADASAYIFARTKRPVATLPEMLGEHDSQGFHYYAYGPYSKLEGLSIAGVALPSRDRVDVSSQVDPKLDPRAERRQRILDYLAGLANRGLRG